LLRLAVIGQFSEAEVAGEMSRLHVELAEAEHTYQRFMGLVESQEEMVAEWQQTILAVQHWDQLSAEEQQALIGLLVKQVEVDRFGNVISITWTPIWDQLAGV
jgi:hypothetical protein